MKMAVRTGMILRCILMTWLSFLQCCGRTSVVGGHMQVVKYSTSYGPQSGARLNVVHRAGATPPIVVPAALVTPCEHKRAALAVGAWRVCPLSPHAGHGRLRHGPWGY